MAACQAANAGKGRIVDWRCIPRNPCRQTSAGGRSEKDEVEDEAKSDGARKRCSQASVSDMHRRIEATHLSESSCWNRTLRHQ